MYVYMYGADSSTVDLSTLLQYRIKAELRYLILVPLMYPQIQMNFSLDLMPVQSLGTACLESFVSVYILYLTCHLHVRHIQPILFEGIGEPFPGLLHSGTPHPWHMQAIRGSLGILAQFRCP